MVSDGELLVAFHHHLVARFSCEIDRVWLIELEHIVSIVVSLFCILYIRVRAYVVSISYSVLVYIFSRLHLLAYILERWHQGYD